MLERFLVLSRPIQSTHLKQLFYPWPPLRHGECKCRFACGIVCRRLLFELVLFFSDCPAKAIELGIQVFRNRLFVFVGHGLISLPISASGLRSVSALPSIHQGSKWSPRRQRYGVPAIPGNPSFPGLPSPVSKTAVHFL